MTLASWAGVGCVACQALIRAPAVTCLLPTLYALTTPAAMAWMSGLARAYCGTVSFGQPTTAHTHPASPFVTQHRPRHTRHAYALTPGAWDWSHGRCSAADDTQRLAARVGMRQGDTVYRARAKACRLRVRGLDERWPWRWGKGRLRALARVRCTCPAGSAQPPQVPCYNDTRAARNQHGWATRWPGARPPHASPGPRTGPAPSRRPHKCPGLPFPYVWPYRRARSPLAGHEAHTRRVGGHGDMVARSAFR